jgi:hypothetical protein
MDNLQAELVRKIEAIIDSCALFRLSAEAKTIGSLLNELRTTPASAQQGEELPPLPGFFKWWTSIETDARKSLLFFAHREPERMHALLRMAFEAGVDQAHEYGATCRRAAGSGAGDALEFIVIGGRRMGRTYLAELEHDAARWREAVSRACWRHTGSGAIWSLSLPAPRTNSGNTDEDFIAAIDAARAANPGGAEGKEKEK